MVEYDAIMIHIRKLIIRVCYEKIVKEVYELYFFLIFECIKFIISFIKVHLSNLGHILRRIAVMTGKVKWASKFEINIKADCFFFLFSSFCFIF